jgi:hypothetical protein
VTSGLNPARLVHFTDWVTTLPPRPLPRTAVPVASEYHLDYVARLAGANHLKFGELTAALDDTASITVYGLRSWKQHEQERLAAAAGQPLARITRLYWPDPRVYLRDPEGFRRTLRPACRRCTARCGITEPVACHLRPHQNLCRRHRLWTGPAARGHDSQLDVSPFPEVLRAQRRHRHLAQLHHPWQMGDAIRGATSAIHHALRGGSWIPGQQRRMRQLAPGTWQHALASALSISPWQNDNPGHAAVEIAIYPDVVWLAARSLRARRDSYHTAV